MFLVDTNVISEIRKASTGKANENVTSWASQVDPSHLFISVITILELEIGVLRMERKDSSKGKVLRGWLNNQVTPAFLGRVISIDTEVAKTCAHLHVPDPSPNRDALIAATALTHNLTLVTRSIKDFKAKNLDLLNPREEQ